MLREILFESIRQQQKKNMQIFIDKNVLKNRNSLIHKQTTTKKSI